MLRSIVEIPTLTAIGRCDLALSMVDAAYAAHRRLKDPTVIAHPGVHLVYRLQALLDAGRLGEAVELAERGYEQASRGGPPLGRTWFAIGLGRAALLTGRPRTARRWLSEGVVLSMGSGFDGPHRLQLSLLATAQAWLGDLDGANESLAELDATPWAASASSSTTSDSAWTAAISGDPVRARELVADCAQRAGAAGQLATKPRSFITSSASVTRRGQDHGWMHWRGPVRACSCRCTPSTRERSCVATPEHSTRRASDSPSSACCWWRPRRPTRRPTPIAGLATSAPPTPPRPRLAPSPPGARVPARRVSSPRRRLWP